MDDGYEYFVEPLIFSLQGIIDSIDKVFCSLSTRYILADNMVDSYERRFGALEMPDKLYDLEWDPNEGSVDYFYFAQGSYGEQLVSILVQRRAEVEDVFCDLVFRLRELDVYQRTFGRLAGRDNLVAQFEEVYGAGYII